MENNQTTIEQSKQLQKPCKKLENKEAQLALLVKQSFNVFNIYGKDSSQLKDILMMFNMALENFEIEDITKAFKRWAQESSKMPTPADIIKCISEAKPSPKYQPPTNDGSDWRDMTDGEKGNIEELMVRARAALRK